MVRLRLQCIDTKNVGQTTKSQGRKKKQGRRNINLSKGSRSLSLILAPPQPLVKSRLLLHSVSLLLPFLLDPPC